ISLAFVLCIDAATSQHWPLRGIAVAFVLSTVAAVIVYLATTTRWLNHLGESYRYIEYGLYFTAPMAIGLLAGIVAQPVASAGFVWFTVVTVAAPILAYALSGIWIKWPDRDVFGEFLREMDLPPRAIVFPIG